MAGDKKLSEFENTSFTREHNVFVPVIEDVSGTLENKKMPLSQFASNQDVNNSIEAKLRVVEELPQNPDNNTFYFVIDNPEES